MLDGLGVALCLFDEDDRTLLWNAVFVRFFPEHAGHVQVGEPYAANLRRFYMGRLDADEQAHVERYIAAGLARHRDQSQPYEFEHRGQRLRVASLPLPGVGRMRLWCPVAPNGPATQATPSPLDDPATLLDQLPGGLVLCDGGGRILWANAPFAQMYGLHHASEALDKTLAHIYRNVWTQSGAVDAAPFQESLQTLDEMQRFTGAPFELPLPQQRRYRILARSGAAQHTLYVHIDITELQRQRERMAAAEQALRASNAQLEQQSAILRTILESMEQGVTMVNAEGRIEYFNQHFLGMLDLPRDLLARQPPLAEVVAYQHARGEFDALPPDVLALLGENHIDQVAPLIVRQRPNGRTLEVRSTPIPGGGLLRTFTDVTERHQHQQHIEHLARHDGLTGLLNRNTFMEALGAEVALAQRQTSYFAVLFIDLDGFKPINDTHGHATGDQVLVWVAQTLRYIARSSDFVARLGGDEFAVLQRGINTPDQASALAQRIALALAGPLVLQGHTLRLGASVGLAVFPEHGSAPDTLLAHADQAMYLAKAGARQGSSLSITRTTKQKRPKS